MFFIIFVDVHSKAINYKKIRFRIHFPFAWLPVWLETRVREWREIHLSIPTSDKKGARVYKQTNDMIAVDREVRCSTLILIPPPFFWHYSPFPLLKFCFFPNKFWPWNLLKMNCSHATINILALGKTSNLGRNKSLKEEKTNAWIYMKK